MIFAKLALLFIVMPILELYLLLQIADIIGNLNTVLLVVITGLIGAYLAKNQGIQTLRRMNYRIRSGDSPSNEIMDGFLILIGGVLLVTPGILTDITGLLFLLPFTRPYMRRYLRGYLDGKISGGRVEIRYSDDMGNQRKGKG